MADKCTHPDCNLDVYSDDKCILHCEKDDWFEINKNGEQDWSRTEDKITHFKEQFNSAFSIQASFKSFEAYIFPKYDLGSILKTNNSFGKDFRISFSKCVFLSEVALIDNVFKNSKEFDSCIFKFGLILKNCRIDDKHDEGSLSLSNSKANKKIIFEKMDVSKIDLTNLDIANAETVKLRDNSYYDAKFKNIHWGNKTRIIADRDEFRQLKFAYDKQANYIEANEFYALEMKARQNELKSIKGHWQDKVVFRLGWFASNHSQNWMLPLFWILLFSVIFYSCAVYWSELRLSFDCYLQFANPFSTKYEGGTGLGWWMINKLFFAFFAYHFIVSLRRNTKR